MVLRIWTDYETGRRIGNGRTGEDLRSNVALRLGSGGVAGRAGEDLRPNGGAYST